MEKPLWTPSEKEISNTNLQRYITWLKEKKLCSFNCYQDLWQWSVDHLSDFWKSLFDYFHIIYDGSNSPVLAGQKMPDYRWFEDVKLNYAEHIFRNYTDQQPAIIYKSEHTGLQELSWSSLKEKVASLQYYLTEIGLHTGDRVVAYMPCTPEATIAFLATNATGAIWSSCSPDFGINSVIERFKQIKPKVLFAVDRYVYNGKEIDRMDVVQALADAIPSLEKIIIYADHPLQTNDERIVAWRDTMHSTNRSIAFTRVPFNHPIWVLYSSGTTGLPKAITHSHGGILLEQLKYGTFHNDYKPGDRCFWYTTTGWMMWNYIHGSLLAGATMVLYDGSPAYPTLHVLWEFVERARISHFGTSAGFILANMKAGMEPLKSFDLSSLRSIGSTGSTLPPEGFEWIYEKVKENLWLASMSGGTDVCSAFVGGNPMLPVFPGEIQCRALGCKLEAFDDAGNPVTEAVGEMVITAPMPSMPVFFWNDINHARYKESYFEMFPGVWRHGDWIMITASGGIIIYGRSDATLNRGGVRIGTSEIYRAVDQVTEIKDSLIICIEKEKGEFWMPLFVTLKERDSLTDQLKTKIKEVIRREYSPRHVPDEIIEAPDIPYTISGKKTETPVKKILMGKDPHKVINSGALRNPESLHFFITFKK